MDSCYDHPILAALCAEAGITVEQVADADNLRCDAYSDTHILNAVDPGNLGPGSYLRKVCDAVQDGNVPATLALRRMFGLRSVI